MRARDVHAHAHYRTPSATSEPETPDPPATGSAFRVPFFSPAMSCIHGATDSTRCDNPTVNGFLHIVNYGTSAASVTITGKDVNGAGGTYTLSNIPAGANRRVQGYALEGRGGFNHNGSGAWSLVVTSTSDDVRVAAFSALGNPAAGFTSLPVLDANATCP